MTAKYANVANGAAIDRICRGREPQGLRYLDQRIAWVL